MNDKSKPDETDPPRSKEKIPNQHNKDSDVEDHDDDQDDVSGLLKDIAAQMEKNDSHEKGNNSNNKDNSELASSTGLVSIDVSPGSLTPGAIRVEISGGAASARGRSGDLLEDHDDGAVAEVDLERPLSTLDGTGLLSAAVVDEEELEAEFRQRMKSKMVEATEVRTEEQAVKKMETEADLAMRAEEEGTRKKKQRRNLILLGIGILVIVVATVLAVTLGRKEAPLSDFAYLEDLFLPLSGPNITVEGTPQNQALNWLAYEDPAKLNIQSTNTFELTQRYVMAVFFYSTGGPTSWVDDLRFLSNYTVCEWPNLMGIEDDAKTDNEIDCNEDGHITKIRVERNNLTGTIPKELGALTSVEILTTGDNAKIVGTLPVELGELTMLTFLQFAGNSLTGTFPESFRKLASLETISLFRNNLSGTLSEEFLKETSYNLEIFDVGGNMFTGTIPDAFNTQSPLRYVFMEDNAFQGPIPSTLYAQPNLQILSLSNNQLNGTIGQQIGALEALRSLFLDGNQIVGSLPSQMSGMEDLEELFLNSNGLEGSIPATISRLTKLKTLDFSNNTLSNSIPSGIGLLENLKVLNLESNPNLSGSLPVSLAQLAGLEKLFIRNTNITAGLNEAFCTMDVMITEIQTDCSSESGGNFTGTVECECCTSCCQPGGFDCDVSVPALCETKAGSFESDTDRGAVCACSEDGTNVTCSDTACESCNLDETSCATNKNYGFLLNETTGTILAFQNTIEYTSGPWLGTSLFYESLKDGPNCNVWLNGDECRDCSNIICSSGFAGFRIQCENVEGGSVFNSCDEALDVGPLEILHTFDSAQVSGCPVLMERLVSPSGF